MADCQKGLLIYQPHGAPCEHRPPPRVRQHRQAMQRFVAEESAAVILACAGVATIAALSAPWNKMLIVIVILACVAIVFSILVTR